MVVYEPQISTGRMVNIVWSAGMVPYEYIAGYAEIRGHPSAFLERNADKAVDPAAVAAHGTFELAGWLHQKSFPLLYAFAQFGFAMEISTASKLEVIESQVVA